MLDKKILYPPTSASGTNTAFALVCFQKAFAFPKGSFNTLRYRILFLAQNCATHKMSLQHPLSSPFTRAIWHCFWRELREFAKTVKRLTNICQSFWDRSLTYFCRITKLPQTLENLSSWNFWLKRRKDNFKIKMIKIKIKDNFRNLR